MEGLTKKLLDDITYEVLGSAIEVHKIMGRGLLESVYQQCMIEEMTLRRIKFNTEFKIPALYKDKTLNLDFRCDFYRCSRSNSSLRLGLIFFIYETNYSIFILFCMGNKYFFSRKCANNFELQ